MLRILAVGNWTSDAVDARLISSSRPIIPEIERIIEEEWSAHSNRPGILLFDGPMARWESWKASPRRLRIELSQTSYKPFLGTNLMHPELADRFGRSALANPVGVSPALLTADGFLLMGRRNTSVAYYPNRIHPFAGAMEPQDKADVFAAARRELMEELALSPPLILDIRCTGIVEDPSLRQPELIFSRDADCLDVRSKTSSIPTSITGASAFPRRAMPLKASCSIRRSRRLPLRRLSCGADWNLEPSGSNRS